MLIPIQISLYGVAPSDALHHSIRDKASKLERLYDRIAGCRVVLSLDARPDRAGKQFSAHVAIKLTGGEIAVTHEHEQNVHVALRDAFAAARRKLEDYVREKRAPNATSTRERSSLPAYCA
jgi:ribosome-associated translation inhibitor RaiA